MKSRGVYETPGGAILYKAHQALETTSPLTATHSITNSRWSPANSANWFITDSGSPPLREALSAFVDATQQTVTGQVRLKLYKGNIILASVSSPYSLYDEEIATFDEDEVYNQKDAEGFINLFGLPIK